MFTDHKSIQEESGIQAALLGRLAVPVGLLDVVVHPNTKRFAAFSAASLQHVSAAPGGHAGPESVHTDAASYFGLVCSFYHLFPLSGLKDKCRHRSRDKCRAIIPYRLYLVNRVKKILIRLKHSRGSISV